MGNIGGEMTPEERERAKKRLRSRYEMRIRRHMSILRLQLSLRRRQHIPMSEVCQIFLHAFPMSSMGIVPGESYTWADIELRLEVFGEIMADCRRESVQWETI